ncbi:hypothetical protein COCMIDRAFT_25055 [Bipolaris oryzae ATCC 44560]|uniref:Uncharacterized protein n=1 Tax=Bipolaris oryzae ATCC 44560 TaxID=930090 RepID=W6ZAJ1_COCMI|nr:uncharacterized protein COCMIDRAFT_25055 [Bipolaris oryzae ATCC 44560]EUC47000.1 hypothetical protein COCMIDRAFT_25055 [Bipolaris oryzae ATCC 44560]
MTVIDKEILHQNAVNELLKDYDFRRPLAPDAPEKEKNEDVKMETGEYSINRLFASINALAWSSPQSKYTTCPLGPNGADITIDEWGVLHEDNTEKLSKIKKVLEKWATRHKDSAFFTLGLQISVPRKEDSPLPTFSRSSFFHNYSTIDADTFTKVPTSLHLQNYPYLAADETQNLKNPLKFPDSVAGRGQNCLCWCETVDRDNKPRKLPDQKRLRFGGNLAEKGKFDGSFVVDHRLFMHKRYPNHTKKGGVNSDNYALWDPQFVIGSAVIDEEERNKLKNPSVNRGDANNDYFKFKQTSIGTYEWGDEAWAPGSFSQPDKFHYSWDWTQNIPGPFNRQWNIFSKYGVKVSWNPGDSVITVSGSWYYKHREEYCPNTSFSQGMCYGEFEAKASWSFQIDLKRDEDDKKDPLLKNGMIRPRIIGLGADGAPEHFKCEPYNMSYVRHDAHKTLSNAIRDSLKAILSRVGLHYLNGGKFSDLGQFVYPGTGVLQFGDPMLNDYGDLIADVTYQEPTGKVVVRPPGNMKFEKPKTQERKPVVPPPAIDPGEVEPQLALFWSSKYVPIGNGRIRLSFSGKNLSIGDLGFKRIKFTFIPIEASHNLVMFKQRDPKRWLSAEKAAAEKAAAEKAAAEKAAADPDAPVKEHGQTDKDAEPSNQRDPADQEKPVAPVVSTEKKRSEASAPDTTPAASDTTPAAPATTTTTTAAAAAITAAPATGPPSVWNITATSPDIKLRAIPDIQKSIFFLDVQTAVPDMKKFALKPDDSWTINMEGEVNPMGTYLLRLTEIWTDPDLAVDVDAGNPNREGNRERYFRITTQMNDADVVLLNNKEVQALMPSAKPKT